MTAYYGLIASSLLFMIEQISLLISVYRDKSGWKFRFSRIEGYPNLRPIQKTIKVTLVIFTISVIIIPIIGILFSDSLISYAESLQYGYLALIPLLIGAVFLIWHYLVEKGWNKTQVLLIVLQFLSLGILFYLNYFA